MAYIHMLTFMIHHNDSLVYAISAQKGDESDIDTLARTICEKRGGIVNVYVQDDGDRHLYTSWDFAYINSGNRTWKVSQDDMYEWEDAWEMSEDFPYIGYDESPSPKSRLEVGKWLIMGDEVRDFLPRAKRAHKRESVRKCRRQERSIIAEQMM